MELLDESERDSGLESPIHSKGDSPERKSDDPQYEDLVNYLQELSKDPNKNKESTTIMATKPDTQRVEIIDLGADSDQPTLNPDSYEDEPDETLAERLWGLTEMFPECVVNAASAVTSKTASGIKHLYSFSRSSLWIVASSSVILFAPIFFEIEIAKIEEKQKSEQKQYLLGPSAAMMGANSATPPLPR